LRNAEAEGKMKDASIEDMEGQDEVMEEMDEMDRDMENNDEEEKHESSVV
jgi:hypothetical protein